MRVELNVPCIITKLSATGDTTLAGGKKEEFCAIVRFPGHAAHSAPSGEPGADAVLRMRDTTVANIGDMLEVDGLKLRVTDVVPVRDSVGKLDHFEVTAMEWS
jgi:hypothetical protein